ncbi:putative bifunctional diguanylate cyclase/phosphodiesterase [Marinobacterium lutimaris]|uniref:PAS domain S-box-containing protein/diguanylate cyclase (GGDEF) domain-containing protein n=1 Tax=Marinobacterium lutimaris TaxID=568106 RepID=A0A1H5V5G8_9GAMM|nr:EAL domain-containing protein [Marinobacterium lutimaris]SEF82662.1 PAS domain S-box-containing protein/diguanylate cyclase (GGDEF) domain-containing protein [Marinobacterium lutimaris]
MAKKSRLRSRFPVHLKLALLLLVCSLLVLGGGGFYKSEIARETFRYQLDARFDRLDQFASALAVNVAQADREQVVHILNLLLAEPDVLRVELLDAEVHPVVNLETEDYGNIQVEGRIVVPVPDISGSEKESGWLIMEASGQSLVDANKSILDDAIVTLVLIVSLSALAILVFQVRYINRPLRQLLFAIERSRNSGELVRVGDRLPNDEFGTIIGAYNELLIEVEDKHRSLKRSEARFRHLYNRTPALLFSLSERGIFENVSEHLLHHLGYPVDQVLGRHIGSLLIDPDDVRSLDTAFERLAHRHHAEFYLKLRNATGDEHAMRVDATPNPEGPGVLAVMTDITSLNDALNTIERQANFDSLTGLPNRHLFKMLLGEQLESAAAADADGQQGLSLLFVDLDRFKYINDTYGHHTGDKLLRAAGSRIQNVLPAGDYVARLGGDEFAVLIHGITDEDALMSLSSSLIDQLETSFQIDQCTMHISASVGIAVYQGEEATPDQLLKSADLAMYRAKAEGRGRACVFAPEDEQRTLHRVNTESLLREALEGEYFELHYQPVCDLGTQRIVGAEGLVRMNHPEKGLLAPGDFIDVAEETGLIVPLGEWVLEEGARQLAQWHRELGCDITLSLNVSSKQLQSSRFAGRVAEICEKYSVPSGHLVLEITESMLMNNSDQVLDVMNRLKAQGCLLSIDDFGTGFSSLSYLQKFPLDVLKIDRAFVMDIEANETHRALVRAIVSMSEALKLRVITEGVETEGQMRCIRQQGCELGQGYYFSRPLKAAVFNEWIRSSETLSV